MDRGAWEVTVHGLTRVRQDLATEQQQSNEKQFFFSSFKIVHMYSFPEHEPDFDAELRKSSG